MSDAAHSSTEASRLLQGLLIAAFLAGIVTPGLTLALDPAAEEARVAIRKENRTPAKFPTWPAESSALDALNKLPAEFDAWFNDHFGFRTALIRWHNLLKLATFRVAPNDKVVVGKDGWIFMNAEESIADFRGLNPFSEAELDEWQRALQVRQAWMKRAGAHYVFVVGPSKHSIYPEMMADAYTRLSPASRLDQLIERMRTATDVPVIDLRPTLLAAKTPDTTIYYPHGTHWNELGGYHAYAEIMRALARWDERLRPQPLSAFSQRLVTGRTDSWATKFHIEDLVTHSYTVLGRKRPPRPQLVAAEGFGASVERFETSFTEGGRRPNALLLRDSFGDNIRKLLAGHFERLTTVANGRTSSEDVARLLERERPSYVIDELVERSLMEPARRWLTARPPRR